jgi:hypothetical protein
LGAVSRRFGGFGHGERLGRFRIIAIDPTIDPDEARNTWNAVWIVEPVDGKPRSRTRCSAPRGSSRGV